ncbi:hypothetical protein [Nocardioides bruguierae]|uniref:hypothetical protein n=1 Tax=Nocardioides bruguierae TaxID=2945102 RepID=UPI00202216A2|nr:hypothetical protein [Nocardioides bruguierae]MCL8024909.1 hypothetical protein [Nocardioides bruguierae]
MITVTEQRERAAETTALTRPVRGDHAGDAGPHPSPTTGPGTQHQHHQTGSTDMHLMPEELARAQRTARLDAAHEQRRGYHLARAQRLSRRAEAAALRARLALARAL